MLDFRAVGRRIAQLAVALGTMAGISTLAHLPVGSEPTEGALRVALRTRTARIEICHDRTEEELAALPAHLRQVRICEEHPVDYRLSVSIDGERLVDRRVPHSGLRHSRPLVVDELLRVAPGPRKIRIRFDPERANAAASNDRRELETAFEELPRGALEKTITFTAGRIELVTLDESGALRETRRDGAE